MFDFLGRRKVWFLLSLAFLLVSLGGLAWRGLNLGIDFTGGMTMDATFTHPVSTAQLRAVLSEQGLGGSAITLVGRSGREVLMNIPAIAEAKRTALNNALTRKIGSFQIVSLNKVTGVISQALVRQGVLAVLVAVLLIIVYMSIRFDFRFALSGILAIFYDVLVSIGLVALVHVQLTTAFMAAVLTIIGYSLNDRIIIFDRIRENRKLMRKEPLAEIANRSLNQTLVRSVNTAVAVLLAMASILIFGGVTTRDFAVTMLIGVFFGAYSSIFVATPIWVSWCEWADRSRAAVRGGATLAAQKSDPKGGAPKEVKRAKGLKVAKTGK